ncbi:TM2 domain-containing protein [Corynebacterium lubricantis]|uniref:TM2 domain-containing protein n=1 Tax=Corynebacterium lubricantis TaxID=541095 RepID=UPI00037729FA|nr:TM2 domain-containing protein [Corynebacterium lubricantis]
MSTPQGGSNYEHNPFDRPQNDQPLNNPPQYGYQQPQYRQPQYPQPQYPQPQPQAYNKDGLPVQPQAGFNQQYGFQQQPVRPKSKVAAALLAFFLGTLGLHNFYLGYTRRGVAQLVTWLIGWVTAIIGIGAVILFVLSVWVIVEFILILIGGGKFRYDSRGVELE